MDNRERLAYIAGIVDGEGYVGIKKSKAYACQGRKTPGYHARIQVRMIDEPAIKFIAETLGGWYYPEKPGCNRGRPLYCYSASDAKAEEILRALLPFLRVKRKQAKLVLAFRRLQGRSKRHRTKVTGTRNFPNAHGTPRLIETKAFSDEYVGWCESVWHRCRLMNGLARQRAA